MTRHVFAELERLIDVYEECDAPFEVWIQHVARTVATDEVLR
jgi:hypothetical protein